MRVPLALRRTAKARSKTRATASCAPKIVASSKGPSMGGNKKASTRGEEASGLRALGKNPIVNAAAGAIDVIPGDYRIGGPVPRGALVLTCGVDVQGDRLEARV